MTGRDLLSTLMAVGLLASVLAAFQTTHSRCMNPQTFGRHPSSCVAGLERIGSVLCASAL